MTAGLPIRPTPAACRISTASPILRTPSEPDYCVSGGTNTGEPWERFSIDQSIKSGRNGSGTKHLVFIADHPSKYWPCSLGLNQPTVPVLQPPLHLSSLDPWVQVEWDLSACHLVNLQWALTMFIVTEMSLNKYVAKKIVYWLNACVQ